MNFGLADNVMFATGASSGIGVAIYGANKNTSPTLTKNAAHTTSSNRIRANLGWADAPKGHQMHRITSGGSDEWLTKEISCIRAEGQRGIVF